MVRGEASEALDASEKRKPTVTELEIGELERIQADLGALLKSANTIGQAVEARLKVLTSKVADNEPASVSKKTPRTTSKGGKAKLKRKPLSGS